jgi:hypothetical protein
MIGCQPHRACCGLGLARIPTSSTTALTGSVTGVLPECHGGLDQPIRSLHGSLQLASQARGRGDTILHAAGTVPRSRARGKNAVVLLAAARSVYASLLPARHFVIPLEASELARKRVGFPSEGTAL